MPNYARMEPEPRGREWGRGSVATILSCILGRVVKVLLRKGKRPGEDRSVSMGSGESGT